MSNIAILSFFIGLIIAVFIIGYMNFRFSVRTNRYMLQAFLIGLFSVVIVVIFQYIAEALELDSLRNIKRTVFYAIVIIAFGAELGKFIVLRYYFLPLKEFAGPLDGIIYSTLIGCGFSTSATILLTYGIIGAQVNYLYIFTYAVANIIFAIIMGFFVGFGKHRENKVIDSLTGLFVAVIFHGLYTFSFLTQDYRLLILFSIGSIIIVILLAAKALNIHSEKKKIDKSQ